MVRTVRRRHRGHRVTGDRRTLGSVRATARPFDMGRVAANAAKNGAPPDVVTKLATAAAEDTPVPSDFALDAALKFGIDRHRAQVDGATFILDTPENPEPVWGDSERVAWSRGEYLLINGPSGVGKTTIAQQLALARLGLRDGLLGMPVASDDRPVLYIAADRPPQAARSLRRMVTDDDRKALAEGLIVWRGPLPFTVTKNPEILAVMADELGVGTIIVDSLKDVATKLTDDETGQAVKQALSLPCLNGVDVVALHHQRKEQQGGGKQKGIDGVYGSTWITAGAGSVLLVWGAAGDAAVTLEHLKQPVDDIGPLTLLHDHQHGTTSSEAGIDLLALVRTSNGLNAEGAARALTSKDKPDRNDVEKARRALDRLVAKGLAHKTDGGRSTVTGQQLPARYYAVTEAQ
jgi:replicative DNA helicase